jgi:hypothetical protein
VDDPHLLVAVLGLAQNVPEGELHCQGARDARFFRPERHLGYQDGGQARGFKGTCQHGHVDGAVRSGGREQDAINPLGFELPGHFRPVFLLPLAGIRWISLEAHEGIDVIRQSADLS